MSTRTELLDVVRLSCSLDLETPSFLLPVTEDVEAEFLFLLFCSNLAVSSVFALRLDECLAGPPPPPPPAPPGCFGASGLSIHQLDLPAPSFWTRTKRLCSERLCRMEFCRSRINRKLFLAFFCH